MKRRRLLPLGAAAAVVSAVVVGPAGPAGASSDTGQRTQFQQVTDRNGVTKFTPAVARANRDVTVILQLAGPSVAQQEVAAKSQGRSLSSRAKTDARAQLQGEQRAVADQAERLGARVTNSYQDAYNGLAVRVPADRLAALGGVAGVVAVHPSRTYQPSNQAGGSYIGANQVWDGGTGLTGAGVKVAIIDTGVDYTHADFGGAGTTAAFEANDPTTVEPGSFPTAKVIGGTDFVGDAYNADDPDHSTPQPDPDPLDCYGHGSHVAGTAAGFGVLADGSTYGGPYTSTTYSDHSWNVAPGVAPQASILAYKVFGCKGTVNSDIVVAALNRASQDGADVVNMSLGSPFGGADDPEATAIDNLSENGVVVVASAGNEGASAYMTGSPASSNRAISVAAMDASGATLPGAHTVLSTGQTIDMIDANGAALPSTALTVAVLKNSDGSVSLGCDPAEYTALATKVTAATTMVVTTRGTCARVARAIFAQQAGFAAAAMINSSDAYPPFEGPITENPDTGDKYNVTIPFLGSKSTDGPKLIAADGGTATLTAATIPNPGYQKFASFSSNGPRTGDSAVKPDVAAPGVSVLSVGVGTGNKAAVNSGTSMAAPMTTGVAALVTQAHPTWSTERIKAAMMNTADPTLLLDYDPRRAGAGVVQAQRAVDSSVLALAGEGQSTLSYGYEAIGGAYSETLPVTIENTGGSSVSYNLAGQFTGSSRGATLTPSPASVTVPAGGSTTVDVTLALSATSAAALPAAEVSNFGALVAIRGALVATPSTSAAGVRTLRVPFLLAPRGLSDVQAGQASAPTLPRTGTSFTTSVSLTNSGIHTGTADVYALGAVDPSDAGAGSTLDIRAIGAQVLPGETLDGASSDRTLVFAVNAFDRWSNPSVNEVDIPIDSSGDGRPDAYVVGIDYGLIFTGTPDGRYVSLITDADFNIVDAWVATAPMNGSTMLLPTLASEVGVTSQHRKATYAAVGSSVLNGALLDTTASGVLDAFKPDVSSGDYESLAPGQTVSLSLSFNAPATVKSQPLGWMVVTLDDANGAAQADLVAIPRAGNKP